MISAKSGDRKRIEWENACLREDDRVYFHYEGIEENDKNKLLLRDILSAIHEGSEMREGILTKYIQYYKTNVFRSGVWICAEYPVYNYSGEIVFYTDDGDYRECETIEIRIKDDETEPQICVMIEKNKDKWEEVGKVVIPEDETTKNSKIKELIQMFQGLPFSQKRRIIEHEIADDEKETDKHAEIRFVKSTTNETINTLATYINSDILKINKNGYYLLEILRSFSKNKHTPNILKGKTDDDYIETESGTYLRNVRWEISETDTVRILGMRDEQNIFFKATGSFHGSGLSFEAHISKYSMPPMFSFNIVKASGAVHQNDPTEIMNTIHNKGASCLSSIMTKMELVYAYRFIPGYPEFPPLDMEWHAEKGEDDTDDKLQYIRQIQAESAETPEGEQAAKKPRLSTLFQIDELTNRLLRLIPQP